MAVKRPVETLVEPIWERQPGESPVAYAGFRAYRDLGEGRTIEKAVDILLKRWPDIPGRDSRAKLNRGTYLSRCSQWSAQNHWVWRSTAWDAHIEKIRLESEEKGARDMARQYEGRVQWIKEREWMIGTAAYDAMVKLLQVPVVSDDGKVVVNKEFAKALPQVMREASRMIRLSADLPTEGAKMPTPERDTGESDVDKFFDHLGSGGEAAPSADLPDVDNEDATG